MMLLRARQVISTGIFQLYTMETLQRDSYLIAQLISRLEAGRSQHTLQKSKNGLINLLAVYRQIMADIDNSLDTKK